MTGLKIGQWLNVELPLVTQTRVDLLAETSDGKSLVGFELQSCNDSLLPIRMAEYSLRVYRVHQRFPKQYVLYVGNDKLRMPRKLIGPDFSCRYKIFDIRDLDENTLLESPFDGENILAILAKHANRRESVRRILARIAKLESGARGEAFRKLMILAGLRSLRNTILTEVKTMPILDSMLDHNIIGPAIRQGLEQGFLQGQLDILRRQIGKRFGTLPAWVDERLGKLSTTELEDLSLRFVDAKSLDELFAR